MIKLNELTGKLTGLLEKADGQLQKSDKILGEVKKLKEEFETLKGTLENAAIPEASEAAIVALDARFDSIAAKQAEMDDVNQDA